MNPLKLYRNHRNEYIARREPDRPDAREIGDEGEDYPSREGVVSLMAATAPAVVIPSWEQIKQCHNKKELWYPWAQRVAAIKHRGTYADKYPIGGVYHFNAGRDNPVATMNSGRGNGYLYSACGRKGEHVQSNPLSQWGYHAGASAARIDGKTRSGVSQLFHGVEVSAAGTVDPYDSAKTLFKPWYFKGNKADLFPASAVRHGVKGQNITGTDDWHKFTAEQEESMVKFWIWMKVNNPKVFRLDLVMGHDEVAVPFGRKSDPGAALSMLMRDFRVKLNATYNELGLK